MDWEYEERVWSILRGRRGFLGCYNSVSEFEKNYLGDDKGEDTLEAERLESGGWVMWWENKRRQQQQQQIIDLLKTLVSEDLYLYHYLIQFWEVVKVDDKGHHHLSSSHLPFSVGNRLRKGSCWYRKLSRGHTYVVDMESQLGGGGGGGDDQEQPIGGVGRAYRNKRPESTPDLKLYSTHEFPMRDEAARCGFRAYVALPLFDHVRTDQCFGVLELLCQYPFTIGNVLSRLNEGVEIAGFKSTHTLLALPNFTEERQAETEISEILELAKATVPRLHLAQVWVPCNQCLNTNTTTNLRCMEIEFCVEYEHKIFNCWKDDDDYHADYGDVDDYYRRFDHLKACKFHNLQIGDSSFHSNMCDLNISKNPLAHYAQRARMSHSFAISLQSLKESNKVYVIQFYLLSQVSYDSVNLLSRIMETNLKSFKIETGRSSQTSANAIGCELTVTLEVMKSYNQHLPESNFTAFLGMRDSCCLRPSSGNNSIGGGWVFGSPGGERLCENGSSSLRFPISVGQKIEDFMKKIAVNTRKRHKWIIQFWAPQTMEGRYCLQTSDQPFAVSCLSEGIASFRKKCMAHYYFVDDEAKEEELGPPGRVFRNKHLEITPDLFLYTTNEFPFRNHAMLSSCSREYFCLPIIGDAGQLRHKYVGVLEFLGFQYSELGDIVIALEAAKLFSIHTDSHPRFLSNEQAAGTLYCRREALTELEKGLLWKCIDIPQLQMAKVWVPNEECATSIGTNMSCVELAFSAIGDTWDIMPTNQVHWIHVKARKGMVGMVLASESKSCFCPNLYEFGIADQPLSHFEMNESSSTCFAICLQSSRTGDLVYVLEFFLNQGPATYEYLRSFLNFLLPLMKHELTSFKLASGKQLGEELVVEVIEFSESNKLDPSGSKEADLFPFKFKTVQYNREKHQNTQEECNIFATDFERRKKGGKRKPRHNLTLKRLQTISHMRDIDAAHDLGVALPAVKRACKHLRITHRRHIRRDMAPSTSNTQPLDVPHTDTEEKVMIKVKYEEDIIRFELCLSLGLAKLVEEVARKVKLEMGSFKLKYKDEVGDEILLTDDDDLQLCRKTQITVDRTHIQLFVR